MTKLAIPSLSCFLLFAYLSRDTYAGIEVLAMGCDETLPNTLCTKTCANTAQCAPKTAKRWYNEMKSHSYVSDYRYTGRPYAYNFTDLQEPGCTSSTYTYYHDQNEKNWRSVDTYDAVLFSGHGGVDQGWKSSAGEYFFLQTSSTSRNCSKPGSHYSKSTHWRLGDGDLEFIHFTACHTAQWSLRDDMRYFTAGLHQMGGFNGVFGATSSKVDDFADDSFSQSINSQWVTEMSSTKETYHTCAINYVFCDDPDDCEDRIDYEQYDRQRGPDPAGTPRYSYYTWLCGCDAGKAGALPDC